MVTLPEFVERNADIVRRYAAGQDARQIGRLYGLLEARVLQIAKPTRAEEYAARQRQGVLRNQSIWCWHQTGMTYAALGRRYGITGSRVADIVAKVQRQENWREWKRGKEARSKGYADWLRRYRAAVASNQGRRPTLVCVASRPGRAAEVGREFFEPCHGAGRGDDAELRAEAALGEGNVEVSMTAIQMALLLDEEVR
jgi:Mor family transcriptional regulator